MQTLEAPCGADLDWDRLYRARGDEVAPHRPYLTGDVFEKVTVRAPNGEEKRKNILIVAHPCAMRSNGVDLSPRLLAAEVREHRAISPEEWSGFGKLMPLPDLIPTVTSRKRHQAALFDELYLVGPEDLEVRIACLSPLGVNLLLQRWVHHSSRVVVPSGTYNEVTSSVYDEADVIEEWVEERLPAGLSISKATAECVAWLRENAGPGRTRQELLSDPQNRSTVRKQVRAALKALRTEYDEGNLA